MKILHDIEYILNKPYFYEITLVNFQLQGKTKERRGNPCRHEYYEQLTASYNYAQPLSLLKNCSSTLIAINSIEKKSVIAEFELTTFVQRYYHWIKVANNFIVTGTLFGWKQLIICKKLNILVLVRGILNERGR